MPILPMWTLLPLVICLAVAVVGDEGPAVYQFSYHVKDDITGQDFGQEEERQGYNTGGEYQVSLPDGRRQIVTYSVADPDSGYVADVSYTGEAKYDQRLEEQHSQAFTLPNIPIAAHLPPIRSKPHLPRAEKILRPLKPQQPSAEEVRFISRPTKIVPTVIKVIQVTKPTPKAPLTTKVRQPKKIVEKVRTNVRTNSQQVSQSSSQIRQPLKIVEKVQTKPRANSPKVSQFSNQARQPKKIVEKVQDIPRRSSLKDSQSSSQSPSIKKPISAFKSVPSTTTTPSPPAPVYIPSETPKLTYKDKYHTAESQVLYSLFREDTNGKKMKPPPKKP